VKYLLNPPYSLGLISEQDIASLQEWRNKIDEAFHTNLAVKAKVEVDSYRGSSEKFDVSNLTDENKDTYWATDNEVGDFTIK